MRFGLKYAIAVLTAFATLAANAHADIRAFNAAVQAGDYRAAVAEASATWPTLDRSAPDAAIVAREFAWVAMLANDPASAQVYSRFLVEQGQTLAHPDMTPGVSRVLHDWVGLEMMSSAPTRTRLMASLQARALIPSRDLISPRAAQTLHQEAWAVGDWAQSEAAAMLAIRFLDELGISESPARYQVRRGLAIASFMRTKSPAAYNTLYDIAGEVHDLIARTPPGPQRDRLAEEYYAALAWGDAVYGALPVSRQRQIVDRRNSIGAGRTPVAELLFPAPGDPNLPRCRLTLASGAKTPGFPFVQRFKDFGGEVIYALDVGANGALTNPRLLAAAPHAQFDAAAQDVIRSWRWQLAGSLQPPSCRMPQIHVLTFEFALGR